MRRARCARRPSFRVRSDAVNVDGDVVLAVEDDRDGPVDDALHNVRRAVPLRRVVLAPQRDALPDLVLAVSGGRGEAVRRYDSQSVSSKVDSLSSRRQSDEAHRVWSTVSKDLLRPAISGPLLEARRGAWAA